LELFPSALSVVGSLALTPGNGDCVRFGTGARFRKIIPKLLRAGRRILASPRRKQPPADPYAPARESWNKKNHDAAIASLDQILAATPTDVIALLMKGQVLLSSGRAREARDPLIRALDLDPENLGALETLAYAEGALNEHDRALACWRRLALRKGLDESTARMIGNETWARDEQRRNSSAFKDLEEGCPPIEQCLSEIARLTASGGEGTPRHQEIIERLCYQIAAQKAVLGRLDNVENFYEYSLVRLRFRNMGVHSYDDIHLKAPPDPPAQIPDPLRNAFSMGGVVELLQGYTNSALPPGCGEYIDDDAIRTFLALNQQNMTPRARLKAAEILTGFAPPEHALTKKNFSRSGGERKQGIMPALPAMVPPDLDLDDWLREDGRYDLIICPLMLDSWGLGRNGEPIDPDADLELMREFHQKLRPAGLLYLRVPIGRDRLIFNTMRIYGAHRLPRLLANWRQRSPETIGAEQLSARVPADTKLLLERA